MADADEQAPTPRALRLEIFVDGTNFQYGADKIVHGRIDVPHLARRIAKQLPPQEPGHILVKLNYCTAPIVDTTGRAFEFQSVFFESMRQARSVELILGRHDRLKSTARATHEEKQTDVNVAIHAVAGAYEDRYDVAMIVTGDTDLVPAMKMVRGLGKSVIWGRFPLEAHIVDLAKVSDAVFEFNEKFLRTCQHFVVKR
jgi:uncharacterized LabA/DUF88 family protein